MHHALRRASTTVAALAILGCTGDAPVAPSEVRPPVSPVGADSLRSITVVRTDSANADSSKTDAVSTPSQVLPIVVAAALSPAAANAAPLARTTVGNREGNRTLSDMSLRERSLGFENEPTSDACLTEGAAFGSWQLRFTGYGCVGLTSSDDRTSLSMQPMVATANEETHAPLVLGPSFGDRLTMTARVETVQQLRKNGEPNAWEVAWVLWQYQDDEHFYYFIPKPNGWELGKRDPSYPGGQRFLATGTDQTFPVGKAYNVQIIHRGNTFSVVVDGTALTTFADTERPYVSGRIALYSEDAEIRVHGVSVRTGAIQEN